MRKLLLFLLFVLTPIEAKAQISGAGNIGCSGTAVSSAAITSGTANNTTAASTLNSPLWGVLVQLDQTTTITGGAVTFQTSGDGTANWVTLNVAQVLNPSTYAQLSNPYSFVASTNQQFLIVFQGVTNFRVQLTTALVGSGSVTPYITTICTPPTGSQLNSTGYLKVADFGNTGAAFDQAPGSATPPNAIMEGLSDGSNTRFAQADANGRQIIKAYPDTTTASYHASANIASAASASDIAVLPGNATTAVLVNRIQVTCTQTTAGIITLQLIKRSSADTSGTHANMTVVPDDANFAAGISVPLSYTANPTTGTAVGNVDTALVGCMATGTASPNDIYIFKPMKPIVLHGTAQQLAVNLNAATITGGSFDVTFDYEETTTP